MRHPAHGPETDHIRLHVTQARGQDGVVVTLQPDTIPESDASEVVITPVPVEVPVHVGLVTVADTDMPVASCQHSHVVSAAAEVPDR
jgi:hypothetical protein